jgi:prephenate dehydrogenase
VAESDVVVLATPISTIEDVARKLGPFTREDGVVIDICSLKAGPVQSMLAYCRGEVVGSHPLFGPRITSLQDQLVFVCPARSNRWIGWFRSFLRDRGAKLVDIDPAGHDRLMGTVQVLRHMLIFCFGRSLVELGFDPGADLPLSGPWFSQLMGMLKNQLGENPELYPELSFPNPATREVAAAFLKSASEFAQAYSNGDRASLVGLIKETADYLENG